jgi:hypothetical protein
VSGYKGKSGERGMILHGSELVDTITIISGGTAGTLQANFPGTQLANTGAVGGWKINPLTWGTTRLKQFAQLFQKYRFRKLQFIFEASQNDFTGGSMGHYVDYDPNSAYTSLNGTLEGLQAASAHANWAEMKVKQDGTCTFIPKDPEAAFWIANTGDVRTYQQGAYFLFLQDPWSTGGSATLPQTIGRLYIRYSCEFWEDAILEGTDPDQDGAGQNVNQGWKSTGVGWNTRSAMQLTDPFASCALLVNGGVGNASVPPNIGNTFETMNNIALVPNGSGWQSTLNFWNLRPGQTYVATAIVTNTGSSLGENLPYTVALSNLIGSITAQNTFCSLNAVTGSGTTCYMVHQIFFVTNSSGIFQQSQVVNAGGINAGTVTSGAGCFNLATLTPFFKTNPGKMKHQCVYEKNLIKYGREATLNNWTPETSCGNERCSVCPQAIMYKMLQGHYQATTRPLLRGELPLVSYQKYPISPEFSRRHSHRFERLTELANELDKLRDGIADESQEFPKRTHWGDECSSSSEDEEKPESDDEGIVVILTDEEKHALAHMRKKHIRDEIQRVHVEKARKKQEKEKKHSSCDASLGTHQSEL